MATGSARFPVRSHLLIPVATLLLHAVFLLSLGFWLWSREHYQFFPLVLVASATLAWLRLQEDVTWSVSPRLTVRVMGIGGLAVLCFAVASLLESHWLGSIAAIFSAWALIWFYGGTSAAEALRGPVFLLLLGIPLPLNLDLKLIIRLQKFASQLASQFLDLYHVRHSLSGVAIATETRSFMVEEACSGIHSLFSCLCVVVLIGVMQRYSLLRTLFNVAQSVIWVIAANVLRVFLVVYAFTVWDVELDSGWRHEALGVVTYAIALLMSLSTDRLFQFVVPSASRVTRKPDVDYETLNNPLVQLSGFLAGRKAAFNKFLDRSRAGERMSLTIIAAVVVLLLMPLSLLSYGRVVQRWVSVPASAGPEAPGFVGNMSEALAETGAMPGALEGWTLVGTERVSRTPDDPMGVNSTIFTYRGHGLEVNFSVDGYYAAWHDLAYCYTAMDWKLKEQANSQDPQTGYFSTRINFYFENDGRHLLTWFSCFDSQMVPVRPGQATLGTIRTFENLLERVGWKPNAAEKDPPVTPPVFQLQLLCATPQELLDHEKENLSRLFERLSQHAMTVLKERSR